MKKQFKEKISQYLDVEPESISLYGKGRVGLYALLKALNISKGDEVIIPAFTCVVVANAIIYIGAKPIYVDIERQTLNMDPAKVKSAISTKTKLIIAQNTFGLSPDFDALNEIAQEHNIQIIEDCTHGFGGYYKKRPNGTLALASFFSTQWNKPFSTGVGGFVVSNDKLLSDKLEDISKDLIQPSLKDEFVLGRLIWARQNILKPKVYWQLIKLYRFLSKYNILIGSSSDKEVTGTEMPSGYFKGFGKSQAKNGVINLSKLDKENMHRMHMARYYDSFFTSMGAQALFVPEYAFHTYLKYPFYVKDKKKFLQLAEENKVPLGEWFVSPIHPIEEGFEKWHYNYGEFPIAEKLSKHMLNLPTDLSISFEKVEQIKMFLYNHKDELILDM